MALQAQFLRHLAQITSYIAFYLLRLSLTVTLLLELSSPHQQGPGHMALDPALAMPQAGNVQPGSNLAAQAMQRSRTAVLPQMASIQIDASPRLNLASSNGAAGSFKYAAFSFGKSGQSGSTRSSADQY